MLGSVEQLLTCENMGLRVDKKILGSFSMILQSTNVLLLSHNRKALTLEQIRVYHYKVHFSHIASKVYLRGNHFLHHPK